MGVLNKWFPTFFGKEAAKKEQVQEEQAPPERNGRGDFVHEQIPEEGI